MFANQQVLARGAAAALALGLTFGTPVWGQTRADEIARQQEEKARTATPDRPSRAENIFNQAEQGKWFVGVPRGWYPVFGSIYPGGGFTPGGGYRHHIGYDSYVDVSALYSLANYKKVQIAGSTPNHVKGRQSISLLL